MDEVSVSRASICGSNCNLATRSDCEMARAFSQSERVAKLQLLPQIEAREKDTSSIWLDLQLKSDAPPLEGQKFKAGESELEFRPCPAAEEGSDAGDADFEAPEGEERPA